MRSEEMVKRELLKKLEDTGLFCDLVKSGIIGANIRTYTRWYDRYDQLRKLGSGKMDAYTVVAEENGVSEASVRQCIKRFEG